MAEWGGGPFRESAVVRSAEPEPLDDRAQLTAPREWAVLAGLGLALAALAVWGAFGSVERTVRVDGALVLSGERRTVVSPLAGAVAEVSAGEGERIAAGAALLRILPAAPARAPDGLAAFPASVGIASPEDGTVAAVLVAPGESVAFGGPVAEIVSGDGGRLDAAAFVPRGESRALSAGMAARVSVETPDGRRSFPAGLAALAPRAAGPPRWLARMLPGSPARARGHVLRLAISGGAFGQGLEDGTPCRIEIVVERTTPFGLLIRR